MRPRAGLLLIVIMTTLAAGVQAQETVSQKTTITGWGRYSLGTSMQEVLLSNPSLKPGSRVVWSTKLPTVDYSDRVAAPIGGFNYSADLYLQFYEGRLAVVGLQWASQQFDSVSEWRRRGSDLQRELLQVYASNLVVMNAPGFLCLKDEEGNRLHMFTSDSRFTISLTYLLASYGGALDKIDPPKGNY